MSKISREESVFVNNVVALSTTLFAPIYMAYANDDNV